MSKPVKLKDKFKKKDLDAFDALYPLLRDYMATIMLVYKIADEAEKEQLRNHNHILKSILEVANG